MRSALVEAGLRVAWRQWTALGISGNASPPDHAIDLEALICFTPILGSEDPRLHDEALDWCISHSQRFLSITRVRHLRNALPEQARDAFDHFAAAVNATAKLKTPWPTDHRGIVARTSGKSRVPDVRHPALIQLRLRCLFGVTARAELLLQFLRPVMTQEILPNTSLSVSDLTDLGYSKPALTDVLADLTMAGLLERWRRGNRDYYTLSQMDALLGFVGGPLPAVAPNWALRFRIAASLLASEAQTHAKKEIVQAVAISKELERLHATLDRAGIKPPPHARKWSDVGIWAAESLLDAQSQHESFWRHRKAHSS